MPKRDDLVFLLHAVALPGGGAAPESLEVPYADTPYDRDGITGVNRLNAEIAADVAAAYGRMKAADVRFSKGVPFYVGHPDYFGPNKEEYVRFVREQPPAVGWITGVEAGDAALVLHVRWNRKGRELIEGEEYSFFSPNLPSRLAGRENGVNIYVPAYVKSAGLTNTPNWSVAPMVHAGDGTTGDTITEERTAMTLFERIKALLGDDTVNTDDDAVGAIGKLVDAIRKWRAHLEERWTLESATDAALPHAACDAAAEIDGCLTALADAAHAATGASAAHEALRTAFATEMVHAAVSRGAVLQEHAQGRIDDLLHAGDAFLGRVTELKALPKLMPTEPVVHAADAAAREAEEAARPGDPTAGAVALIHARMAADRCDYRTAFNAVERDRPELFGAADAARTTA